MSRRADDEAEVKEDENVLILTEKNFEGVLEGNDYVLVEFYAPWCGRCKALAPEYAKAAGTLKEQGSAIKLAKVDATQESNLAEKYEVRGYPIGYPTLKFFKNGKPVEYGGGRTSDEIVSWLEKKTCPLAKALETADAVKEFIEAKEVAVVGFFKDSESDAKTAYLAAADSMDDVEFGIVIDAAIMAENNVEGDNGVVIFKKFDEGRVALSDDVADKETIKKFINENKLPLVVEFTDEAAPKIFGGSVKSHILMFISKTAENFATTLDDYRVTAKEHKGKVLFIYIDTDVEDNSRILEFFGLAKADVPAVRLINRNDMVKYKPVSGELTKEAIGASVKSYLDGELKALNEAEGEEEPEEGCEEGPEGEDEEEPPKDEL